MLTSGVRSRTRAVSGIPASGAGSGMRHSCRTSMFRRLLRIGAKTSGRALTRVSPLTGISRRTERSRTDSPDANRWNPPSSRYRRITASFQVWRRSSSHCGIRERYSLNRRAMRSPLADRFRRSGVVADSSASVNSSPAAAKLPFRSWRSAISRISALMEVPSVISLTLRISSVHLENENAHAVVRPGRALMRRGSV